MTAPDLSFVIPTKWKPWVGAVGALLTFVVPYLSSVIASLPPGGQAGVAAVLAGLTWLGVYQVPYAPKDTVLKPKESVASQAGPISINVPNIGVNPRDVARPAERQHRNPWQS